MLKKIMLAALAAGALALNAPVATADPGPVAFDCGFDSNQQEDVTGQNYEGAIYGYVAHAGDNVSITCDITVNGTVVSSASGSGSNFATAAGRATFAANDTDVVELCYTVTTSHGPQTGCFGSTHIQIPPQEVIDLLDQVFAATGAADGTLCPILDDYADTYGPITITADGDVLVDGELWWDCPPYGV